MNDIKMSDAFELPLLVEADSSGSAELGDANYHLADFDDTLTYDDGKGVLRAELCAIAVNAYDANRARIAELESLLKKFKPMDEDGHGGDFVYNEDSTHLGDSVMKALKEQG